MTAVLCVGLDPATMDYTMPGLPAGLNADSLSRSLDAMIGAIRAQGYDADLCGVSSDAGPARDTLERALGAKRYDVVSIGAGVRLLAAHTVLFEALVNTVREAAPGPKLCFNSSPTDTLDAIRRQAAPG